MKTLSLEQAAAFLFTTPETVTDKIHNHGLPAVKVGRAWVLIDDDVAGWLRAQYREAVRVAAIFKDEEDRYSKDGTARGFGSSGPQTAAVARALDARLARLTSKSKKGSSKSRSD